MAKNRLNFEAHLGRHSHNTDGGYASSLCMGAIVPQYFDVLSPGETVYFQPSMFVRLQDVVTAFFGKVDVHMDAFFVPMSMLYTAYGQIFTQTDDVISSFYGVLGDEFPLFDVYGSVSESQHGIDLRIKKFEGADCVGKEFMRLLDALDENPFIVLNTHNMQSSEHEQSQEDIDDSLCKTPYISPWLFCAYQAIYQKFYRNEEFEQFDIHSYNIDSKYLNIGQTPFVKRELVQLRYHQRLSDYFTDLRISPIASAVNKVGGGRTDGDYSDGFPLNGGSLRDIFYKVDSFLSPSNSYFIGQKINNPSGVEPANTFDDVSVSSMAEPDDSSFNYINTSNIRSLFALDKYLRIWGRAGKTYDDQILAHFGVKIPHDVKHDLTHIKHYQASLTADPIYGTANIPLGRTVENQPELVSTLGQVGAQAQCTVSGDSHKFTAPVHGVFMIVAYALSKPIYEGTFSKLHLLTNRLSFPIPEFDKLGAQPMYAFEYNRMKLDDTHITERVGWQNRYEQFKRKYNRCSFTYSNKLLNYRISGVSNVYSPWLLSRVAFETNRQGSELMAGQRFFEPVNSLDTVMVKQYDETWQDDYFKVPHLMFQTDPLITDFYCKCKKVSWMSETGEPDL